MNIKQVLLAQAARDAEKYPSDQAAMYMGAAAGGAAAYATLGEGLHHIGRASEQILDTVNPQYEKVEGKKVKKPRKSGKYMPGGRMAGGLVGAVLGGALGPTIRNEMIQESPAARILAKVQTGELTAQDTYELQQILSSTYSQMGIG